MEPLYKTGYLRHTIRVFTRRMERSLICFLVMNHYVLY